MVSGHDEQAAMWLMCRTCTAGVYGVFVLRPGLDHLTIRKCLKNKNPFHVPQPTVSTTLHKTGLPMWLEDTLLFMSGRDIV